MAHLFCSVLFHFGPYVMFLFDLGPRETLRLVACTAGSATTRAGVYNQRKELVEEEDRIQRYTTMPYRAPEMIDLYQYKRIDEKVGVQAVCCCIERGRFFDKPVIRCHVID